jgi:hypothetical protein
MDEIDQNRPYLSTAEAAKRSGLTQSYIATLARTKVIKGFQMLHERFVYIDSLEAFLASPRVTTQVFSEETGQSW